LLLLHQLYKPGLSTLEISEANLKSLREHLVFNSYLEAGRIHILDKTPTPKGNGPSGLPLVDMPNTEQPLPIQQGKPKRKRKANKPTTEQKKEAERVLNSGQIPENVVIPAEMSPEMRATLK